MEEATLKIELIDKIEHADFNQLREISGLLTNYFNSKYDETGGWDSLSEHQKKRITESIAQADAGLGTPVKEVLQRTRDKFNLNG